MKLPDIETFSTAKVGTLLVAAATSPFFERRDLLRAAFMDEALLSALRRWHDDIHYYMFTVPNHLMLGEIEKLYRANPDLEDQIDAMMRWIERCSSYSDQTLDSADFAWGLLFAKLTGKSRSNSLANIAESHFPSLPQARVTAIVEACWRLCYAPKQALKASVKPLRTSWWPYGSEAELAARAAAMEPEDRVIFVEYYVDRQVHELDFDLSIPTYWFREFVDWYVTQTTEEEKALFHQDALAFGYQEGGVWLGPQAPLPLEAVQGPPRR